MWPEGVCRGALTNFRVIARVSMIGACRENHCETSAFHYHWQDCNEKTMMPDRWTRRALLMLAALAVTLSEVGS